MEYVSRVAIIDDERVSVQVLDGFDEKFVNGETGIYDYIAYKNYMNQKTKASVKILVRTKTDIDPKTGEQVTVPVYRDEPREMTREMYHKLWDRNTQSFNSNRYNRYIQKCNNLV